MDKLASKINFALALLTLTACSQMDPAFKNLGSSLLSSTGYVSGSQVDAAFSAGAKLAKSAETLNDEQEYYLGRAVAATVFSKYPPLQNSQAIAYVNKVGRIVAAASDKPETYNGYKFMILDTSEINALSAPGGYVFLTKGFLGILPDEDALASVLAHEVAHIAKDHGVSAISSSNLTGALLIIGKEVANSQSNVYVSELTNLFGDSVNQVVETLISTGYSRSQEYEADAYATQLLIRTGYNPTSLRTALEQLEKSGIESNEGGWAATHPKPTKRLDKLEDVIPAESTEALANPASQAARAKRFKAALKGIGGTRFKS